MFTRSLTIILIFVVLFNGCGAITETISSSKKSLRSEFIVNCNNLAIVKDTMMKKLGLPHYKDSAFSFIRYSYGQVCYFLVDDKVEEMISADFEQKTKREVKGVR